MTDAVIDTHGLIWYMQDDPNLGQTALAILEDSGQGLATIYVPTICLVEITYLQEKGRISANVLSLIIAELSSGLSGFKIADLTLEVAQALAQIPRTVVPDMPDRIIAATALHLNLPLITRDEKIQASHIQTIW